MKRQYTEALEETGFVVRTGGRLDAYNENAANTNLVKAVVFGGLNSNLAEIRLPESKYDKVLSGTGVEREKGSARDIKFYTQDDGRVFCTRRPSCLATPKYSPSSFLTYFSRMTTTKTLRRTGPKTEYAVLFFGGQVHVIISDADFRLAPKAGFNSIVGLHWRVRQPAQALTPGFPPEQD